MMDSNSVQAIETHKTSKKRTQADAGIKTEMPKKLRKMTEMLDELKIGTLSPVQ